MKMRDRVTREVHEALDLGWLTGEALLSAIREFSPEGEIGEHDGRLTFQGRLLQPYSVLVKSIHSDQVLVLSRQEKFDGYEPVDEPPTTTIDQMMLRSEEISGIARERYYVSADATKGEVDVAMGVQALAIAIVKSCPGGHDRNAALAHLDDVLARALRSQNSPHHSINEFPVMRSI